MWQADYSVHFSIATCDICSTIWAGCKNLSTISRPTRTHLQYSLDIPCLSVYRAWNLSPDSRNTCLVSTASNHSLDIPCPSIPQYTVHFPLSRQARTYANSRKIRQEYVDLRQSRMIRFNWDVEYVKNTWRYIHGIGHSTRTGMSDCSENFGSCEGS